ncbi:metallophosphoesterase [Luteolibacter sp. LG18]|uniref:metallophosphoesterase n=1 Tax=Luteolibacter sp. LG18 TaxID=2819286 RepID=UPI002B28F351|nr:phosphatase [Luteolibacter sp. LG18]
MKRRHFITSTLAGSLAVPALAAEAPAASGPLTFGLITDAQYTDAEPQGERHYRTTPEKLKAAVEDLAARKLPFTFHLGDFIDRDFKSFATLLPLLEPLGHPVYHLLGNHDYSITDAEKSRVVQTLGMPHDYYSFRRGKIRFIVLDTNGRSLYKYPADSKGAKASEAVFQATKAAGEPGAQPWNGGVDNVQLDWLERELEGATAAGETVLVCAHHPILPADSHQLWQHKPLLDLLVKHRCVKAWLNGHNHDGDYALHEGIHFITFRSILQRPGVNAWAIVTVHPDRLVIEGKGREVSRDLPFRA